jgi:hypothetical protein
MSEQFINKEHEYQVKKMRAEQELKSKGLLIEEPIFSDFLNKQKGSPALYGGYLLCTIGAAFCMFFVIPNSSPFSWDQNIMMFFIPMLLIALYNCANRPTLGHGFIQVVLAIAFYFGSKEMAQREFSERTERFKRDVDRIFDTPSLR